MVCNIIYCITLRCIIILHYFASLTAGSIHEQRSLKTHGEAERARKELAQVHELCTSQFAEAQKKAQQELEAVKQHFQKELQLNIIQHTEVGYITFYCSQCSII